MNASKTLVQLLIGLFLIWCFVESITGASTNMQKSELNPCGWCYEESPAGTRVKMQERELKGLGGDGDTEPPATPEDEPALPSILPINADIDIKAKIDADLLGI